MINGIINVYKERGFTSHDVVAKLRGILHQKKIGHTGTLDPEATGVLPVCLGNATRLCDMLTDTDKVYRARMLLGLTTDTQDTSGKILSDLAAVPEQERVEAAIHSFVGAYDQIPPMYSALKIGGKKLYELAREGREVQRQPRRVNISYINIEEIETIGEIPAVDPASAGGGFGILFKEEPENFPKMAVTMSVECSKGTYIRTLCNDIGEKLGVGGCMSALERTRVGIFKASEAKTLDQIARAVDDGNFESMVIPVDAMFKDFPKIAVNAQGDRLLHNGNPLGSACVIMSMPTEPEDGLKVRVYDASGTFTGIYAYCKKSRQFKVVKMFL